MSAPDWAASGRTDAFSADLVDPITLETVRRGVRVDWAASSVQWDYTGDNVATASIKLLDGQDYRIGRKSCMVRLMDSIALPDGTAYDLALGTFFCMYASGESRFGRNDRTLSGYSCLWRHSQDSLVNDFWRAAGYGAVAAIRDLVGADGGQLAVAAGVDESRTFGNDIWFEAGSGKLGVINEIASWIGCEVMPGPDGRVVLRPYRAPACKDASYTFQAGASCVYKAGMSWSSNRADLVNRVVYVYTSDGETQTGRADLPATHRMSYENVGYHCTKREEVSEMPDGGVQAAAERLLAQSSVETVPLVIDALLVPGLQVGDVVRYVNAEDWEEPLDVRCQVEQINLGSITPGLMAEYKLNILDWS